MLKEKENGLSNNEHAFIILETVWYKTKEESCSIRLLLLKRMHNLAVNEGINFKLFLFLNTYRYYVCITVH